MFCVAVKVVSATILQWENVQTFFRIFRLYQILVEGGQELTLVPGPDCSLKGPDVEALMRASCGTQSADVL